MTTVISDDVFAELLTRTKCLYFFMHFCSFVVFLCVFLDAGLSIRLENISTPEVVVREGQEVNFTCGFDIEDIGNYTTVMSIEKPPGNVLEKCLISVGSEETDCGDDPLITTTVTRSLTDIYYYSMIVSETSRLYGGAALRCNVSYKSQLQWMSEAYLTVTVENGTVTNTDPPSSSSPHLPSSSSSTLLVPRSSGTPPPTPTMDESTDDLILYVVMAILATLLILGLGVATAVVVCHFYRKKKSHSEGIIISHKYVVTKIYSYLDVGVPHT